MEDIKPSLLPAEDTIIKSEYYEKIINKVHDLLFITDPEGKVKFSFGKKLIKLNDEIVNDFQINKIFSPSAHDEFNKYLGGVKLKRRSEKFNLELLVGSETKIYECRIEPLVNKRGQIHFIFFFLNDITDIIKHNEKISQQLKELQQFSSISDMISESVIAADNNGIILFCNKTSENLFGIKKDIVTGQFVGKALELFDETYFDTIKEQLKNNKSWKINLTIYRDTERKIIEARFSLIQQNNILIIFTNITERTSIDQQLHETQDLFKAITENTDDLICNLETDGIIHYVNKRFIDELGYTEKEIYGKNFSDFIDGDFLKDNKFELKDYKSNPGKKTELPLKSKFGEIIYFTSRFKPVYFENKTVKYYNGFLFDVSSIKRAEKDLMIFKTLFEASEDGIAVEKDGKLLLLNKSFASIFGYQISEELINKDIIDLVSNNDSIRVSEYFQMLERRKDVPGRYEFLGKKKDNSVFFTEMTPAHFSIEGNTYVVIVARDVSERKRAQQAIRESEEKYRNITENIDDFLFSYEKTHKLLRPVFYTSSVEKITGYTQTDFLTDARFILKLIHPDDFPAVKKKLKTLLKNRIQISEEMEYRIINKHGNTIWVRTRINLVRSVDRQIQKVYGLVSDISLRKKAEEELNKSTENLVKLNETKDKFISIISHDLRTPFSSILGFTDLLLDDEGLSDIEKKQYIQYIKDSSRSMLSLVNSLLDWTRLQTGRIKFEPQKTNITDIALDSLNALSGAAFQKNINIYSELEFNTSVYIDKNLILQVFNNLLSNAIKFTNSGGEIKISGKYSDKVRFYQFTIKDNGVGIKQENIENLFRVDTKFSSEGTAGERGTGLGLSLVKEIVEKHGGTIWVDSSYGNGSEFHFTLPIASAAIMLVDSNKTDRLLYSKILKSFTPDYNIEIASDGKEALEKIAEAPPALIITEHSMPVLNGFEMVLELSKMDIKGKPPVIILSSSINRNIINDYNEIGVKNVFSKPVNLSHFKTAVEKALRSGLIN